MFELSKRGLVEGKAATGVCTRYSENDEGVSGMPGREYVGGVRRCKDTLRPVKFKFILNPEYGDEYDQSYTSSTLVVSLLLRS